MRSNLKVYRTPGVYGNHTSGSTVVVVAFLAYAGLIVLAGLGVIPWWVVSF